jgi:hypothetical protein
MLQISFAADSIEEVVSGAKWETLRVGEDFSAGEVVELVRQNGERVGFLKILEKSEVAFAGLGESDVRSHNSGTLERLRMRLLSFYPDLNSDSILTRYRFKFMTQAKSD